MKRLPPALSFVLAAACGSWTPASDPGPVVSETVETPAEVTPEPVVAAAEPEPEPEPEEVVEVEPPAPSPPVRAATDLTLPVEGEWGPASAGPSPSGRLALRLTVAGCRVEEAEPEFSVDDPTREACVEANRLQFASRSQRALVLSAGLWRVTVENRHTDRDAGLWIRRAADPSASVLSAGGAAPGGEQIYEVELTPGDYLYSCPITPTVDYRLEVRP